MKKILLTILAITTLSTVSQAKEINLECEYTGVKGSSMISEITIDTIAKQMSDWSGTGLLIITGDSYSTSISTLLGITEIKINRSDLSWKMYAAGKHFKTSTCKLVEKQNKI